MKAVRPTSAATRRAAHEDAERPSPARDTRCCRSRGRRSTPSTASPCLAVLLLRYALSAAAVAIQPSRAVA